MPSTAGVIPRAIGMEGQRFAPDVVKKLESMGYIIRHGSGMIGRMGAIMFDPKTGFKTVGADPRNQSYAVAW